MNTPGQPADDGDAAPIDQRFTREWIRAATAVASPADWSPVELLPTHLAVAAATVLGTGGAGLSILGGFRVPLGASSDDATTAERLQFTLGDGPCIAALTAGRTAVFDEHHIAQRWPMMQRQLTTRTPYHSVVSVPLDIAPGCGGALDLYLQEPSAASQVDLHAADVVARQVSVALQSSAAPATTDNTTETGDGGRGPAWLDGPAPGRRMTVWVAVGMLMHHLSMTADSALATLRARAFAHDLVLDDLAVELVERRIHLDEIAR